jgi:hypothetical protein
MNNAAVQDELNLNKTKRKSKTFFNTAGFYCSLVDTIHAWEYFGRGKIIAKKSMLFTVKIHAFSNFIA